MKPHHVSKEIQMKKLALRVRPTFYWLAGLLALVIASGAPHKL